VQQKVIGDEVNVLSAVELVREQFLHCCELFPRNELKVVEWVEMQCHEDSVVDVR
jgi:hypothetical protein